MDILICIIPKIEPLAPTVGPALLKTCLEQHGFTATVRDLNIELYQHLKAKSLAQRYYYDDDNLFNCHNDNPSDEFMQFYQDNIEIFQRWADEIAAANPRWLGMSLLSRWSQSAAVVLSQLVRARSQDIKIVWGGCQATQSYEMMDLIDKGLIDCFINGDAENAIIDLLTNGLDAKSINTINPIQISDLASLPVPNYDDIRWQDYDKPNDRMVYITASRGCVKSCSFCNVRDIWPQFYMRPAESIANEIRALITKHGRTSFKFTDSLINGNMKIYRQLLVELGKIKKEHKKFSWISQWIVRSRLQSPESDYDLLKDSGCVDVEIGVESFSESVRYHMGKRFTNDELWWAMEQLRKRNISSAWLMISGYPTETQKDHRFTIKTLKKLYQHRKVFTAGRRNIWFSFTPMLLDLKLSAKLDQTKLTRYVSQTDWTYGKNSREQRIANYNEILDIINHFENDSTPHTKTKMVQIYEKNIKH